LNYLKSKGIDINKKIVGIHPGATWPAKMWLKENFAILADKITSKTDASVVITHSKKETNLASEVYNLTLKRRIYLLDLAKPEGTCLCIVTP
jgi:ADP-heptose:LPS heptosyltransferase